MNKKKVVHLEVIRIIALFCIVYNHIGYTLFEYTTKSWEIVVSLVLSILCKTGVPLFFMVSGALLLGKEESWTEVYKKRVLRIAEVIVVFTILRFLYECCITKTRSFSVVYLVKGILTGNILHPYWFLYTYLSILLILPIFRLVVKNLEQQGKKYLLALMVVFFMVIPLKALIIDQEWQISLLLDENICYWFLGYFIEWDFEKNRFIGKNRMIAFAGILIAIGVSFWMVVRPYIYGGEFAREFIPMMSMPLACGVFYLIKSFSFQMERSREGLKNIIVQAGSCVFGVYLIEDYLRKILAVLGDKYGFYTDELSVCVFSTLMVVVIGIPIVYVMKKLPVLKKIL